jgi:hypothetical protein
MTYRTRNLSRTAGQTPPQEITAECDADSNLEQLNDQLGFVHRANSVIPKPTHIAERHGRAGWVLKVDSINPVGAQSNRTKDCCALARMRARLCYRAGKALRALDRYNL